MSRLHLLGEFQKEGFFICRDNRVLFSWLFEAVWIGVFFTYIPSYTASSSSVFWNRASGLSLPVTWTSILKGAGRLAVEVPLWRRLPVSPRGVRCPNALASSLSSLTSKASGPKRTWPTLRKSANMGERCYWLFLSECVNEFINWQMQIRSLDAFPGELNLNALGFFQVKKFDFSLTAKPRKHYIS